MSIWFDSRDLRYKDPFGAVSCGAEVRFALGADEPLEECCLLVLLFILACSYCREP